MSLPESIRDEIKDILWSEADRLGWSSLSANAKSRYYTIWTKTEKIGGRLAGFMDPRQIRVYIKDTLLKSYTRERFSNEGRILRILDLPTKARSVQTYIKPHGRKLDNDQQIAWGRATEWKTMLMALHERSFEDGGKPHAVVLFEAATKYMNVEKRAIVEDAAKKLGIERVIWLD